MNLDRALGVIGLILTIVGLVYPLKITYHWILPLVGILAILYSLYTELLPPTKNKFYCYYYDLTDNDKGIVRGKKITVYKIYKNNVTQLTTSGLSSTGKYEDFKSNIGGIATQTNAGGSIKVICNVDVPFKKGTEVTWVLTYTLKNSFDENEEEVGVPTIDKSKIGSFFLEFDPKRMPYEIRKIVSKNKRTLYKEQIKMNSECPQCFWRFTSKFGRIYSIKWKW